MYIVSHTGWTLEYVEALEVDAFDAVIASLLRLNGVKQGEKMNDREPTLSGSLTDFKKDLQRWQGQPKHLTH